MSDPHSSPDRSGASQAPLLDRAGHRRAGPGAALFTLLVILTGLLAGRYVRLMPPSASEESLGVDGLYQSMLGIAAAVFLLVFGALAYALVRFRRRPGHEGEGVPIRGSNRLELAWTIMPALVVAWLAAYSSQVLARLHEVRVSPLVIEVTAQQFVWQFGYPDYGVTSPELHLPAGRPVQLELHSLDVIHSLWVPVFRLKQDALPQATTFLRLTATRPGTYPLVCAELCGAGHAIMLGRVIVHEPAQFLRWIQDQGQ